MSDFKLGDIQGGASGMDAFFEREPQMITPPGQKVAAVAKSPRVKVGSLTQLNGFHRLSAETLVHKSTNDLWSIKRENDGYYIERLFQDGAPVKG
jgi:hypothetical protein